MLLTELNKYLKNIFSELRTRKLLAARNPQIELALLPNAELRALKKKYLKKTAKIVDVLAFPARGFPAPEAQNYLGEVYINKDIARTDPDRATALLIHGALHLLGYRHARKRDSIVMESLELELYHAVHGRPKRARSRHRNLVR